MNTNMGGLILGTVQFGLDYGVSNHVGRTTEKEVVRILDLAWTRGIRMLDTAVAYGNSEEVLGRSLEHPWKVVSKFPSGVRPGSLREVCTESLKRLGLSKLYGFLAHDAEVLLLNPSYWDDLVQLRNEGLVEKIGYSLYTPDQWSRLNRSGMEADLVQLPFSVFDRRFEPLMLLASHADTEVHARSAFLQGLAFIEPDTLVPFFDPVKPFIRTLHQAFPDPDRRAAALLSFSLAHVGVDYTVFGVNTLEQLQQNLDMMDGGSRIGQHDLPAIEIPESILLPVNWPKHPCLN